MGHRDLRPCQGLCSQHTQVAKFKIKLFVHCRHTFSARYVHIHRSCERFSRFVHYVTISIKFGMHRVLDCRPRRSLRSTIPKYSNNVEGLLATFLFKHCYGKTMLVILPTGVAALSPTRDRAYLKVVRLNLISVAQCQTLQGSR